MRIKKDETVWCPGEKSGMLCILKEGLPPPTTKDGILRCQLEVLKRLVDEADAEDPSIIDDAEEFLMEQLPENLQMVLQRGFLRHDAGRKLLIMDCPEDRDTIIEQWRARADPKNAGQPVSKWEAREMAEALDLMHMASVFVESDNGTGVASQET